MEQSRELSAPRPGPGKDAGAQPGPWLVMECDGVLSAGRWGRASGSSDATSVSGSKTCSAGGR